MRLLLPLLLVLSVALTGCEAETCAGACHQYYGEFPGCDRMPNGNRTQEQAEADCTRDCNEAMNTSAESESNGGRVHQGGNEHDAIGFIRCVTDQDYSDEKHSETCTDKLRIPCGFGW